MKLMLDVINEETGEVRGEVKIDTNLLRLCKGNIDRLHVLVDAILDVAEEG